MAQAQFVNFVKFALTPRGARVRTCARAEPGCLTFRYVYQGDGSLLVARVRTAAP